MHRSRRSISKRPGSCWWGDGKDCESKNDRMGEKGIMKEHLCDICKKAPARIQITGEGQYCLECHNEMILKKYGLENTFDYPKTMIVMEPGGKTHTFRVEHVILGASVSWDAYEQGGDYHFREISDIDENGTATAKKFFRKIVDSVCTKSLHAAAFPASNLLHRDEEWLELRDKGTINIIEDEDRDYQIGFEIDGKKFRGQDLERLFGPYPGFTLQYHIQDASRPVLKEDEYLMPVYITRETLIDELEVALNIYGDRGFVSYKDTMKFEEVFYKIADKLEVLSNSEKHDNAVAAGREMIRILTQVETDDDYFPIPDIQLVCKIVDPFGTDEEITELCRKYFG